MDVRHTIFIAGVIIYILDHEMKLVSGFYLFLWKLDSEPVLPRNLVVGLCSVILLSSYLIYFFHNAYNATNLLREYDFSTSQWQTPLVQKKKGCVEQPTVFAPTKLKPGAPSCWNHFRGRAYYLPWVKERSSKMYSLHYLSE